MNTRASHRFEVVSGSDSESQSDSDSDCGSESDSQLHSVSEAESDLESVTESDTDSGEEDQTDSDFGTEEDSTENVVSKQAVVNECSEARAEPKVEGENLHLEMVNGKLASKIPLTEGFVAFDRKNPHCYYVKMRVATARDTTVLDRALVTADKGVDRVRARFTKYETPATLGLAGEYQGCLLVFQSRSRWTSTHTLVSQYFRECGADVVEILIRKRGSWNQLIKLMRHDIAALRDEDMPWSERFNPISDCAEDDAAPKKDSVDGALASGFVEAGARRPEKVKTSSTAPRTSVEAALIAMQMSAPSNDVDCDDDDEYERYERGEWPRDSVPREMLCRFRAVRVSVRRRRLDEYPKAVQQWLWVAFPNRTGNSAVQEQYAKRVAGDPRCAQIPPLQIFTNKESRLSCIVDYIGTYHERVKRDNGNSDVAMLIVWVYVRPCRFNSGDISDGMAPIDIQHVYDIRVGVGMKAYSEADRAAARDMTRTARMCLHHPQLHPEVAFYYRDVHPLDWRELVRRDSTARDGSCWPGKIATKEVCLFLPPQLERSKQPWARSCSCTSEDCCDVPYIRQYKGGLPYRHACEATYRAWFVEGKGGPQPSWTDPDGFLTGAHVIPVSYSHRQDHHEVAREKVLNIPGVRETKQALFCDVIFPSAQTAYMFGGHSNAWERCFMVKSSSYVSAVKTKDSDGDDTNALSNKRRKAAQSAIMWQERRKLAAKLTVEQRQQYREKLSQKNRMGADSRHGIFTTLARLRLSTVQTREFFSVERNGIPLLIPYLHNEDVADLIWFLSAVKMWYPQSRRETIVCLANQSISRVPVAYRTWALELPSTFVAPSREDQISHLKHVLHCDYTRCYDSEEYESVVGGWIHNDDNADKGRQASPSIVMWNAPAVTFRTDKNGDSGDSWAHACAPRLLCKRGGNGGLEQDHWALVRGLRYNGIKMPFSLARVSDVSNRNTNGVVTSQDCSAALSHVTGRGAKDTLKNIQSFPYSVRPLTGSDPSEYNGLAVARAVLQIGDGATEEQLFAAIAAASERVCKNKTFVAHESVFAACRRFGLI